MSLIMDTMIFLYQSRLVQKSFYFGKHTAGDLASDDTVLMKVNFPICFVRRRDPVMDSFAALSLYLGIIVGLNDQSRQGQGGKLFIYFFHQCLYLHEASHGTAEIVDMRVVGMVGDKIPAQGFDAQDAQKRIPMVEGFRKARKDALELQGSADRNYRRESFRLGDGLMQCQRRAGGKTGDNDLLAAAF